MTVRIQILFFQLLQLWTSEDNTQLPLETRSSFYSFILIQKELYCIFTMVNPKLLVSWCSCCPFYWFLVCGCRLKILNTDENKLLTWTSWDCCYNSMGHIVITRSITPHCLRLKIELLVHWINTSLWNRSLLMAGYKQKSVSAHLAFKGRVFQWSGQ